MISFDPARQHNWWRLGLLLLLVLMHLAVWLGLDMFWRKASHAQPAPSHVQLSLLPPLARKQVVDQAPVHKANPSTRQPVSSLAAQVVQNVQSNNSDTQISQRTPIIGSIETTEPGPASSSSERLNLRLPARPASAAANSPAQLAALDPRGNSQRPDMGERMAVALGSDPSLREDIIAPGHRRFRQGSSCIDVNDTRNSQLNPFDENARMGAKLMSKCKD